MKPTTRILFIILTIFFTNLFFQGCSKDSPTSPEKKETSLLASKMIDNTGGTLKTDNFEVIIPAGTFETRQEIKISVLSEDNLFSSNAISDFFVLDGLPTEFFKPVKVKIKYNGTLSDTLFVAVGEHNFVNSLNGEATAYNLISATDSSGYLVTTLPVTINNELGKRTVNSSTNGDELSINLGAVAGYVSYKSPQGHFLINAPSSVITNAYDLAEYLETAYSKFQSIGFSYTKRTKWPIDVTVKRLSSDANEVYGYYINSVWGNNYGYMQFNFDKIDDTENIKVTAGHEFFHLVQSLYDPRYGYSKAKSPMPTYWLDEASSVWSESFFSSHSNYLSPIFSDNVFDVFKGAKTGNEKSTSEQYGYGMASFIKYIIKNFGDNKIVDVYNNIYNGKSPFQSLSDVLPINVGFSWHSYLKSLLTFDLYSGDSFRPGVLLSYTTGEHQKFIIKSASDSLATYKSQLSDLSATIFSVENQFSAMSDNVILEFTCKGWNFQLYKVNSSTSEFFKSGKDILTIDNFKQLTKDGYKIVAALYNDDYDSPFDHSKEYEMEIRVKMPPKKITAVKFNFGYTGTYKTDQATSSYYDTFWNNGYVANTTSQIIGNLVTVTEVYDDIYSHLINTTEIVFDNIDTPSKIVSINTEETNTYLYSGAKKVRSAKACNIPFLEEYDNGTKRFFIDGDISQYLTELTFLETDNNNATTKQLLSYQSEGSIEIMIYYEQ